ncbi:MAG: fused MFS/spermidine synthase [Acidobacteria bacterium]|nr:fused MFS/spermidine synthase [Acidobacteriota bacterium]
MAIIATKIRSARQTLRHWQDPENGLVLSLDGAIQFTGADEYRYHECLAVLPVLFGQAQTVFIGGGGDGLAAARLLRFPEIRRIVVCDYDPEVTRLARRLPDLRALNEGSLDDPRVEVVHEDARAYLAQAEDMFDLILCDFPDPFEDTLADLYTREFYTLIAEKLHPEGVVCVQTVALPRTRGIIIDTLATVFPQTLDFTTDTQRRHRYGFCLAGRRPLVRQRPVPSWCRYLEETTLDRLIGRKPGENVIRHGTVNRRPTPVLGQNLRLESMLYRESAPFSFNSRYRVIEFTGEPPVTDHDLTAFIEYAVAAQPVIFYVDRKCRGRLETVLQRCGYAFRRSYRRMIINFPPENIQRLIRWWRRLDNGSIVHVDPYHCRTSEQPELRQLLAEYLARHADRYLDIPDNPDIFNEERLHLVARDRDGRAAVLMVAHVYDGVYVDILYGRSSSRANMLGNLLCIRYIQTVLREAIHFDAATHNVESLMIKVGARAGSWLDVFVPAADAAAFRNDTANNAGSWT